LPICDGLIKCLAKGSLNVCRIAKGDP